MHPLWLASWYPDRTAPFNGDFVQRHALALSGQMPVTVIHVAKEEAAVGEGRATRGAAEKGRAPQGAAEERRAVQGRHAAGAPAQTLTRRGNLTERITYVRSPAPGRGPWNKLLSQVRTFRAYHKAFRDHVRENGKPELVHVHVCMTAGLYALFLRWTRGIPYVVTEHYTAYIPGSPEDFYSRPLPYRVFNRMILRRARAVHSVSRFLLEQMERIAPLQRTIVIPNAVDTGLFHAEAGTADTPYRFIHISSFQPFKNVPGILDAFALLHQRRKDWELVLVGPAGEDIRAYGAAKNLPLHWTGEIPYTQVAEWLRTAGALVHFSWVENQPCVISEALCCGVPVVAAAVGGIPEVLGQGAEGGVGSEDALKGRDNTAAAILAKCGLLVPSRDVPALADALERIINTPCDREALASAATAIYSYEVVGSALASLEMEAKTIHSYTT